jgi:transcription elongation GreA/GreB family factor
MMMYIGAALGNLKYQGQSIQIISAQSPLAIALKGKTQGSEISFNQKKYKIELLA